MQTKPYSLQAPEDIAKEYGGNKQAIAKATQAGLIDPTAAVLAGMFIDRMRNAAAQEQAPQQTVAQQVFAPPASPAGLGATPQAQQMPQMAPPPAPTQMAAASAAQPTAMLAGGGLADLPVSEAMFPDEYAGGGIVAFADGGVPGYKTGTWIDQGGLNVLEDETDPDPYARLRGLEDYFLQRRQALAAPEREAMAKYYKEELPELLKKRKAEDFWTALTLGGLSATASGAPSTGNVLQDIIGAVGTAGKAATPYILEGIKSSRKGEEEAKKGRYELEKVERAEQLDALKSAESMYGKQEERRIAAASKTTNLNDMFKVELAGLAAEGKDPNDPKVQREAMRTAAAYVTYQGPRVDLGQRGAATEIEKAITQSDEKIDKEYKTKILMAETDADRARLERERDAKKEFRAAQIRSGGASSTTASTAGGGGLPPGLPAGSVQIGTSGGKRVYKLPNGDTVIEQ